MGKGALTCSSSSGSTFAKVLGKTCGVFLGWLRYSTRKSPSVRDECHVCKRVYWYRHRETAKSQCGGHGHEQLLKLHSGCSVTAQHGAVDVENSSLLGHPILGAFHLLGERVWEGLSIYFFLESLGCSGQLLQPLQHLWHCWYRRASFRCVPFRPPCPSSHPSRIWCVPFSCATRQAVWETFGVPEDSGIDEGSQQSWTPARLTCTLPSQVR